MKIPLFFNALGTKVSYSALVLGLAFGSPAYAHAGFLAGLFGASTEASEIASETNTVIHNSQTVPLLEASVNPDIKNIKDAPTMAIVEDEALVSNTGPLGIDSELEKYASSAKIDIYIVKKGDTIESIAKQFKMTKADIAELNSDLSLNSIKIGQKIVIIPLKEVVNKKDAEEKAPAKTDKKETKEKTKPVEAPTKKADPVKTETPKAVVPEQPVATQPSPVEKDPTPEPEKEVSNTQKSTGTVVGGYIWPFPAGKGRISQGLHSDKAYDFAAPVGTPIYAIQDGTVLISRPTGYNGGYGLYVVINFDDGRQAIFGHMSKVVAEAGDAVKQGDLIGYVGNTGKSTGPHVHIGFRGSLSNPYAGLKVNTTGL